MSAPQRHVPILLAKSVHRRVHSVGVAWAAYHSGNTGQAEQSSQDESVDPPTQASSFANLQEAITSQTEGTRHASNQTILLVYDVLRGPWTSSVALTETMWIPIQSQLEARDAVSARISLISVNDSNICDLLDPAARKLRKVPDTSCCIVSSEDEFKQLIRAAAARVEGRDALADSIGMVQAIIPAQRKNAQGKVIKVLVIPASSAKTSLARSISSVLRIGNILREASEVARIASGGPAAHTKLTTSKPLATVSDHYSGIHTVGATFHLPTRDSALAQILTPALLARQGHSLLCIYLGGATLPSALLHLLGSLLLLRPLAEYSRASSSCVQLPYHGSLVDMEVQAVQPSRLKGMMRQVFPIAEIQDEKLKMQSGRSASSFETTSRSMFSDVFLASPPSRRHSPLTVGGGWSCERSPSTPTSQQQARGAAVSEAQARAKARSHFLSPQDVRTIHRALARAEALPCGTTTVKNVVSHSDSLACSKPLLTFSSQARLQSAARMALSGLAAKGSTHDTKSEVWMN